MSKPKEVFDYGRYDLLMTDPRTQRVFKAVEGLAKKMDIDYDLIGGAAVYLHSKNPPLDYPDIDFLLYTTVVEAREFVEKLSAKPLFSFGSLEIIDGAVFGMIKYDGDIQIDILTDLEEPKRHGPVKKKRGVSIEPVEYLIIEKMMRPRPADVRAALDLLAYIGLRQDPARQTSQREAHDGRNRHALISRQKYGCWAVE